MPDEDDVVVSTQVPRESIPLRTLEQVMHVRALLVALLYTQTELLAHLSGRDFDVLIDGKLDMVNDYVTDFVRQLNEAGKIDVLDENGNDEKK